MSLDVEPGNQDLDDWFVAEILPLEPMLMRFLRRSWSDEAEAADLRQETYIRVYSHPAHLTVLLSPARVKVNEGGRTFVAVNKSGDVFWSNAVTHETENVGGANVRSLIIELKTAINGR